MSRFFSICTFLIIGSVSTIHAYADASAEKNVKKSLKMLTESNTQKVHYSANSTNYADVQVDNASTVAVVIDGEYIQIPIAQFEAMKVKLKATTTDQQSDDFSKKLHIINNK